MSFLPFLCTSKYIHILHCFTYFMSLKIIHCNIGIMMWENIKQSMNKWVHFFPHGLLYELYPWMFKHSLNTALLQFCFCISFVTSVWSTVGTPVFTVTNKNNEQWQTTYNPLSRPQCPIFIISPLRLLYNSIYSNQLGPSIVWIIKFSDNWITKWNEQMYIYF